MVRVEFVDATLGDQSPAYGGVVLHDDGTVEADEFGRQMLNAGRNWTGPEADVVRGWVRNGWRDGTMTIRIS